MNTSQSQWAFRIEPATESDVPVIFRLIKALAEYERLSHEVVATESVIRAALFGPTPAAEAVIAHAGDEPAGFAVFFLSFSTFRGDRGLYLEDLFVEPQWRRRGLGRKLLAYVASAAVARGCSRMNWSVLDWNESAIRFYQGIGAEPVREWKGYGISGEAFRRLAEGGRVTETSEPRAK
jgi:GNAT superfamily N-acetyltransferase